jgi:branched-chain amino acid aminotransferase
VDGIPIGTGRIGPVTKKLQSDFFDIVTGQAPDRYGWLTLAATPEAPRP